MRLGRTVSIDASGFKGLAGGSRVKVLVTSGTDFRPGQPMAAMNFVEPYLRTIFDFIGITQVEFVYAYDQAQGNREAILAQALAVTRSLAAA